jgi:arabinofuranosyltransferase
VSADEKVDLRTLVAYGLAALVWAWFTWRFAFVCDDAFISFRYAHHLAEGNGLVYNPARAVPVEGYSNFLWVVWLSVFERLGINVSVAACHTSRICGLLLLFGTMRLAARRFSLGPGGLAATGLFLASLPAFDLWSTGGLATMPTALAIFGVLHSLHGSTTGPRPLPAVLWGITATLIRADGIGYVILILVATFVRPDPSPEMRKRMLGAIIFTTAAVLTTFISHALWRHSYYGEWLPNTARIKAGLSAVRLERGALYVSSFLVALPAVAIGIAMGMRRWREGPSSLLLATTSLVLGTLVYAIRVGGDFMPFGRFFIPALPGVALLFAWGWSRLVPRLAWVLTLLCVLTSAMEAYDCGPAPRWLREATYFRRKSYHSETEHWRHAVKFVESSTQRGRALARYVKPGEAIIVDAAGTIPYIVPDVCVYDTYGIVTPEVLISAVPSAEASPGHDISVPMKFFLREDVVELLPLRPTYYEFHVTEPGNRRRRMPRYMEDVLSELAEEGVEVQVEDQMLGPGQGFPENTLLSLLRIVWP